MITFNLIFDAASAAAIMTLLYKAFSERRKTGNGYGKLYELLSHTNELLAESRGDIKAIKQDNVAFREKCAMHLSSQAGLNDSFASRLEQLDNKIYDVYRDGGKR